MKRKIRLPNYNLMLLILILILTLTLNVNSNQISISSKKNNQYSDYLIIWKQLFTVQKSSMPCKITKKIEIKKCSKCKKHSSGVKDEKESFNWVKKWGFQNVSYLFDYLDPILRNEIIAEFESIYQNVFKINNKEKILPKIRLLDNPLRKKYFIASINKHQINEAQKKFNWNIPGNDIKGFIKKYDMNYDGRLSPKELILASIYSNILNKRKNKCSHCYENVSKKIIAIFKFIDCGKGYITAEMMWKTLSKLQRNTDLFNIYKLYKKDKKVTTCMNDFILKNMQKKTGVVYQQEFLSGILLGYWDRHTNHEKIITDDSKTLKLLRWKANKQKS